MSIQSTLSTLRQSQSTVEMTIGDGIAQGTQPSFISSPIGRLLLNFNSAGSAGYIYVGNALRVGFEQHNTGDVTLDFQGYAPVLEGMLNTDYGTGNLTLANYNGLGALVFSQWFGAGLALLNCPNVTALDVSSGGLGDNATGNLHVTNCAALTAIYVPSVYGEVGLAQLPALTTLYFFSSVATQIWLTDGLSTALANVVFEVPFYGYSIQFIGCALTQSSVDGILSACDTGGQVNGYVNLSGGSSSPPSYDVGASAAYLNFSFSGSPMAWIAGNSYYFTLWDGQTFWFYVETADLSGYTVDPGIEGAIRITPFTVSQVGVVNDIAAELNTRGYAITTDYYSYVNVTASAPGLQGTMPVIVDDTGSMIAAASQGSGNNASSLALSLQGKGWTIITN